jgi:hypothetical protein
MMALVCVACDGGSTAPTDGGGMDGSTRTDGGPRRDGATAEDAGPELDGGAPDEDAGAVDGGPALDGGPAPTDAGPMIGCGSNADCTATQYCQLRPNTCGGRGICVPRPDVCPPVIAEVCGCDGTTYSSSCDAQASGVNVASDGPCSTMCELRPRGGCCFANTQCARSQRCVGETCSEGGEGTCVNARLAPGQCWEDSDCRDGRSCVGANRCPCGAACLVPDSPGTCGGDPTM